MALDRKQTVVLSSPIFGKDRKFKAEIQKVEKDFLTIELASAPVEIPAGTPLTIWFWDETAIFSFETVTQTAKPSIAALFKVSRPRNIKKSVKRTYKRVRIKIQAVLLEPHGLNKETVYITDLSAGGAKIVAKPGRPQGSSAKISFTLPDNQSFDDVGCDITRITKLGTGLVEYGLEFKVLSKVRRQKLYDFIANAILTDQVQVVE